MIKIENVEVVGWEHAIRGMRNPKNSWDKSDSGYVCGDKKCSSMIDCDYACDIPHYVVRVNDQALMMRLAKGGPVHAKYRRMITVYLDITAPLYWWKEFDTYKVGTVANSCSTMHKIDERDLTLEDFSHEKLLDDWNDIDDYGTYSYAGDIVAEEVLRITVEALNFYRKKFLETGNKRYWEQMIQLLPSSYNQKRTIMLNYEVLVGMYRWRKDHKLDEWREFCKWIESLPYSELITGGTEA